MQLNKQALLDWGRKAAEVGVERVLSLAENVESVARHAADRYNRLAETAPVKLPRIPLEVSPAPCSTDTRSTSHDLPHEGPIEVSTASMPVSAPPPPAVVRRAPVAEPVQTARVQPELVTPPAAKAKKVPGRSVLRRWKRDEVVALCAERGIAVADADTKSMLIGKLHGEVAPPATEESEAEGARLPQRATLMKRNRAFVEKLATRHGVTVDAMATKRQIIDQLYAAVGLDG